MTGVFWVSLAVRHMPQVLADLGFDWWRGPGLLGGHHFLGLYIQITFMPRTQT